MKRNFGSMTGLLAILAIALHTAFPTGQEGGGTTSTTTEKSGEKKVSKKDNPDEPPEGPWLATRAYFRDFRQPLPQNDDPRLKGLFSPDEAIPNPQAEKLRKLFGVPQKANVYSMVATVPDPLHTRLALHFDGSVDAIERAVESQYWTFSQQWLPWLDPATGPDDDISERRHQRRLLRQQESLPGILVFRRDAPEDVLFVFLVPDSPTGGIAGESFSAALNLANILPPLGGPQNEIGLLAPTFSGSFPSLSRLLNQWVSVADRKGPKIHQTVFGGQVSSLGLAQQFTSSVRGMPELKFHSGIVNTYDYQFAFECAVLPYYGVERSAAAYLLELETGYANVFSKDSQLTKGYCPQQRGANPLPEFRFSRDIAHLRNAYREMGQGVGTRNPGVLPSVDFTLKDPTRGEDSIPIFSETGNSMTQSASLDQIMEELKHERIRMIYVVATNPLDLIFVTQLVRREAPDTRIVVGDDPPVLFIPAAAQEPLTGTLFLATYPMFFHGYDWLNPDKRHPVDKPLSYEQGLTNAAQLLLAQVTRTTPREVFGYGRLEATASPHQYPGLWLLTLTRTGFFPLNWFDATSGNQEGWFEPYETAPSQQEGKPPKLEERFSVPEPSLGWYFTTWGVSIVIFVACFFLLLSNFWSAKPLWLALTDNYRARIPALMGACLSLSALEWILLVPARHNDKRFVSWALIGGGLAFVTPLLSGLLVVAKPWVAGAFRGKQLRTRDKLYPLFFLLLYNSVLGLWYMSCGGLGYADQPADLMFKMRALQLYSGASPALPLLLLGCLFFATFTIYFYRFTQTGRGRPRLFQLHNAMQKPYDAVESFIGGPGKLPSWELETRWAVCVVVLAISTLALWGRIRPFEEWPYIRTLDVTIAALALALSAGCYDLWFTWRNLRRILDLLQLEPLDDALRRVSQTWARRPVWAFQRSVSEESLAAQMTRALHSRLLVAGLATDLAQADLNTMREAAKARFSDKKSEDPLDTIDDYQIQIATLGGRLAENDVANRDDYPLDIPREKTLDTLTDAQKFLCYSADFAALYYCNYIIYAAMQIQRIAWGVTLSMVMLTVVLNSYSPQGPLVVGRFVALVFVAVAAIVVAVFAGMERDPILSRIARTKPGELNAEFWFQIAAMGLLPAIGVLTHLFPSMASFLSSWVAPTLDASR